METVNETRMTTGQGNNALGGPAQTNNLAAVIGETASQQILAKYAQNMYNVPDVKGNVKSVLQIDSRFVHAAENRFIQFDITNGLAVNKNLIFGSLLGIQGNYQQYGASPSACDFAGMSDNIGGAFVQGVQGFNSLVNFSSVIVGSLKMISSDTTQQNQNWVYFDLAYDFTLTPVKMNTTAIFTRFDQDQSVVPLEGRWTLGPQTGLQIASIAGKTMTLTIELLAEATVKNYKQIYS